MSSELAFEIIDIVIYNDSTRIIVRIHLLLDFTSKMSLTFLSKGVL